jgi:hypothetical protein
MVAQLNFGAQQQATGPGEVAGIFGVNNTLATAPVVTGPGPERSGSAADERSAAANPRTAPVADILHGFYGLDPATLAALQGQLLAGGFFPPSYYNGTNPRQVQFGTTDDDSYKAFQAAVTQAARSGRTVDDIVGQAVAANSATPDSASGKRPRLVGGMTDVHVVHRTAPEDIAAAAQKTAQDTIGRKFTKKELDAFTAGFNAREVADQQRVYAAQDQAKGAYVAAAQGQGGTGANGELPVSSTLNVTDPANIANAADAYAHQIAPAEAQGHDLFRYFRTAQAFLSTPGGWA